MSRRTVSLIQVAYPRIWRGGVASLLVCGLLLVFPPVSLAQDTGILVESNVEGAVVQVDGEQVARTDAEGVAFVDGLAAGEHTVQLQKEGYEPASRTVTLQDGLTTSVTLRLERSQPPARGSLQVQTLPGEASIFLNGQRLGRSDPNGRASFSRIRAGEYRVVVRKEGFEPAVRTVYFDGSGVERTVDVQLQRSAAPSTSSEASPTGEAPSTTPGDTASAGDPTAPSEGETPSTSEPAAPNREPGEAEQARLLISTDVADASVFIEGTYHGQTSPDGNLRVRKASGEYTISVEKDGFPEEKKTIRLEAGQNRTVRLTLRQTLWTRLFDPDGSVVLYLVVAGVVGALGIGFAVARWWKGAGVALFASDDVAGDGHFDRYYVLAILGQGDTSTVYRAYDPVHDRPVALKLLDPSLQSDPDRVQQFLAEREILRTIHARPTTPPAVRAYQAGREYGRDDGRPYIALELVPGDRLDALLERSGPLSAAPAVSILLQICRALQAAHHHHIWHRGVTPDDVIVHKKDSRYSATLIDFGRMEVDVRPPPSDPAKAPYLSPEHCRGKEVDGRSDVYSVGMLFYAMVTGSPPFTDPRPERILQQHEEAPRPELPPEVPGDVRAIVSRMVSSAPADRPSVKAVVHALKQLQTA